MAGVLCGALLALVLIIFGFWAFLLVAVFMGIGALLGRLASGKLDLRDLANAFSGRRTS
jgi:uncharacterized membrane protein